jgi:hypothetical protein
MKTEPAFREDGTMVGFHIGSALISMRLIKSLLRSVPGVSLVQRQHRSDDHIFFVYKGVRCTVNEPWGDSSHYWISPENVIGDPIDLRPVHDVFATLGWTLVFIEWLAWVSGALAIYFIGKALLRGQQT